MKILPELNVSCKKAAELIDKKAVLKLSLMETYRLKTHMGMCALCKVYESQSLTIEKATQKILRARSIQKTLPDSIKSKIINSLKG